MLRTTKLTQSDRVLDFGCGEGTLALILGKYVDKVMGVDINPDSIDGAQFKARELARFSEAFSAI